MPPPIEFMILESNYGIRFTKYGVEFRMGVINFISELFQIRFLAPCKICFCLATPSHCCFTTALVTLQDPLSRPGVADRFYVFSVFRRLSGHQPSRRGPMDRHFWQDQPGAILCS